jgi:hypothetical protein
VAQATKSPSRQADEQRNPAETIAGVVALPLDVARKVFPQRGLPVYLGIVALTITNVIEWPVAVAAGLGYVALREWQRPAATDTSPQEA